METKTSTPGELIAKRSKGEKGVTNQVLFHSLVNYFSSLGLKVKTLKVNVQNIGRKGKPIFQVKMREDNPSLMDRACASLNLDIRKHMNQT